MTTFQDIMPMISFVEFPREKKSMAEITQRSAYCSQFPRRGILFDFLLQLSSQLLPEFR